MTMPMDKFEAEQVGYEQTLGRRHAQMIAIGTDPFLGSASRLNSRGPAPLFSNEVVGVIAFFVTRTLAARDASQTLSVPVCQRY